MKDNKQNLLMKLKAPLEYSIFTYVQTGNDVTRTPTYI